MGIEPTLTRWERAPRLPEGPEAVVKRLCLPADRVGEVADALAAIPPRPTAVVTLTW
jgi:hypothetical protein